MFLLISDENSIFVRAKYFKNIEDKLGNMNIVILGAGKFGKAMGHVLAKRKPALVDIEDGSYSDRSKRKISEAELLIICVPSQALKNCCKMIKPLLKNVKIISCIKALYEGMKTPTEIIKEELGVNAGALSGLNFAEEIMKDIPTRTTIAGPSWVKEVSKLFKTKHFHPHVYSDAVGLEFGSAAKNVLALAVGIIEGKYGKNSLNMQGALLAKGIEELSEVCKKCKNKKIPKLPFFADVFGSCKANSRNLEFGKALVECKKCKTDTVEGLQTLKRIHNCAKTPLIKTLYEIVYKSKSINLLENYLR